MPCMAIPRQAGRPSRLARFFAGKFMGCASNSSVNAGI
jgi:hypothetical protein